MKYPFRPSRARVEVSQAGHCASSRMVGGFITQRPSRRPFLRSIRSGTLYAPILLSKNCARKSSREQGRLLAQNSENRYKFTPWALLDPDDPPLRDL
jgi:hypothetical protein